MIEKLKTINPKKDQRINLTLPLVDPTLSNGRVREGENLAFFEAFNIIKSHIFPENFIEISQVVQKIRRLSLSILVIFINFHPFFGFFDIFLLQRNL